MKSKVFASLAAVMAVSATCAFAANPFVDVPTDSWAYKSVVELADAGVIQGVDGQYFQGQRSITRYEAAEMVAKAMAHMDKASVEQRALINKLADEYAGQVDIYKVNVDEEEELAALFGIRSVPSLLFVPMNGTPQMAQGALPKKNLKEAIQNVLLKND